MFHWLCSPQVRRQIPALARGTTVKNLDKNGFLDLKAPLPPISEQERIAAILSSVDDTIKKTQAVIDQLEVVKKGLLGELLTRGMPKRHTDFRQTELGEIPASWRMIAVGSAGEWYSGGTPSKAEPRYWSGTIPWVSPKDMKRLRLSDAIDHVSEEAIGNGTRLVPEHTIFVVVRGMILSHSFPVAITERAMTFNQDMKALCPSKDFDPEFLLYWLLSKRDHVLALIADSSHGTKRLPTDEFFAMPVPVPPLEEQKEIASGLRSIDAAIQVHREEVEATRSLKAGLLDALLSGKIRVSVPTQEAS
jgi:type I restriction enzyme S subunit